MPLSSTKKPADLPWRWVVLFLLACSAGSWVSLGNYPLSLRSEGRYASSSLAMAQTNQWLVPQLQGESHLTKPPLIYWCQAASLKLFGYNEWAVRLPSALASSLTMLGVFLLGWRLGGKQLGMLAAGVLALMPLHLIVGRLSLTDPLLELFWFGTLACGYLACEPDSQSATDVITHTAINNVNKNDTNNTNNTNNDATTSITSSTTTTASLNRITAKHTLASKKWAACMWLFVSLSLMTKGPLALLPLLVLLIWQSLGKRWQSLGKLRWHWGLLAFVPLLIWVILVVKNNPNAIDIWRHEILDRAVGKAKHNKPTWYFLALFFGAMLPASFMLTLPGLSVPWAKTWRAVKSATHSSLWGLAIIIPLIIFSLNKGKLPAYILPLSAPTALLAALTIAKCLTHTTSKKTPKKIVSKLPKIHLGICLFTTIIAIAFSVIVTKKLGSSYLWAATAWLPAVIASWMMFFSWHKKIHRRATSLAAVWCCVIFAINLNFALAAPLTTATSNRTMIQKIREQTGLAHPYILNYAFDDFSLAFYAQRPGKTVTLDNLLQEKQTHLQDMVLIAEARHWRLAVEKFPALTSQFKQLFDWQYRFKNRHLLILVAQSQSTITLKEMTP